MNFHLVLYLLLLAGSTIFIYETFQEYLQASTFYSVTKEPLTLNDLPTLTLCWVLWPYGKIQKSVYGKNFTIDVRVLEKQAKIITLIENQHVPTIFGLKIHLEEIWPENKVGNPCFYYYEEDWALLRDSLVMLSSVEMKLFNDY